MIDPDEHEQEALDFAGQMAGELIESIGKTDLAEFTSDEWAQMIECAVTGFQDKLRELLDGDSRN